MDMNRQLSTNRPSTADFVWKYGQKNYTLHVGVEETEDGWRWLDVSLQPGEQDYADVVSRIVRSKYTSDDVEAILNNYLLDQSEEHKAEFDALQEWRAYAKETAKSVINTINSELYG